MGFLATRDVMDSGSIKLDLKRKGWFSSRVADDRNRFSNKVVSNEIKKFLKGN